MSYGDIRELNFNNNDLNDSALTLLQNIPSLTRLKLRNNLFTQNAYKYMFPMLKSLRHLDLSDNPLTDGFFRNLTLLIIDNQDIQSTIEVLELENC